MSLCEFLPPEEVDPFQIKRSNFDHQQWSQLLHSPHFRIALSLSHHVQLEHCLDIHTLSVCSESDCRAAFYCWESLRVGQSFAFELCSLLSAASTSDRNLFFLATLSTVRYVLPFRSRSVLSQYFTSSSGTAVFFAWLHRYTSSSLVLLQLISASVLQFRFSPFLFSQFVSLSSLLYTLRSLPTVSLFLEDSFEIHLQYMNSGSDQYPVWM